MINELSVWMVIIIAINLSIAVTAICAFRFLLGLLAGVNTADELSQKDNYAFGLVFAGGAGAIALILAAAVGGEAEVDFLLEATNVLTYAIAGIILLKLGSAVNDLLMFHEISLKKAISEHNISAGIVQSSNLIALGILLNSAINWVESENWEGILPVALVFVTSQIILLIVTRLRTLIYRRRHPGESLQGAILNGNPALAIRFAGHVFGTTLAVGAAGHLVDYIHSDPLMSAVSWGIVALILTFLLSALSFIARKAILAKIDVVEEVDIQQNVGIAFIEAAIFISIGLLLDSVLV
jgi:uncharacterized membrane protein YjfL (UPF0719 family)